MKSIFLLISFWFGLSLCGAKAQVVSDPLKDYYQRVIKGGLYRENDDLKFQYTPQTQVYCFKADFTGADRKSFFITDEGQFLNAHGRYGWAVYVPVASGGYQMVTDESTLIAAGANGPPHIGYIDQLKGYGIVTGSREDVTVFYLDNGTIQSKIIDQERGHADPGHYPKYFHDKPPDHQITTYTVSQLAQKFGGQ